MNFDSLADGLYGLPPGQFVAERTAAEKKARASGDRELAGRIHALGKPTTVGWLANQLQREHPEEIGPLLELGSDLRAATASLSREKLKELMRLQHQVLAGLIKQARTIARDAGQRISEDAVRSLEDTLRAALADESLGERLREGRLTGALEHDGFPGVAAGAAPALRPLKRAAEQAKPDERLLHAEQALEQAHADAEEADEAAHQAEQQLAKASTAVRGSADRVQQLEADLERARQEHSEAKQQEQAAKKTAEKSAGIAEGAHQELKAARAKRDELAS